MSSGTTFSADRRIDPTVESTCKYLLKTAAVLVYRPRARWVDDLPAKFTVDTQAIAIPSYVHKFEATTGGCMPGNQQGGNPNNPGGQDQNQQKTPGGGTKGQGGFGQKHDLPDEKSGDLSGKRPGQDQGQGQNQQGSKIPQSGGLGSTGQDSQRRQDENKRG